MLCVNWAVVRHRLHTGHDCPSFRTRPTTSWLGCSCKFAAPSRAIRTRCLKMNCPRSHSWPLSPLAPILLQESSHTRSCSSPNPTVVCPAIPEAPRTRHHLHRVLHHRLRSSHMLHYDRCHSIPRHSQLHLTALHTQKPKKEENRLHCDTLGRQDRTKRQLIVYCI